MYIALSAGIFALTQARSGSPGYFREIEKSSKGSLPPNLATFSVLLKFLINSHSGEIFAFSDYPASRGPEPGNR
jgi:hypothetical protein